MILDGIKAGVLMGIVSQLLQKKKKKNQAGLYFDLLGFWKLAMRKGIEYTDWNGKE